MSDRIEISVEDPKLARALRRAIDEAVRTASALPRASAPVVRVRTRKRLAALASALQGALVVVAVTEKNVRRVPDLVAGARAGGAAGVQIVWDGATPPRHVAERPVFAALESARATPGGAPVVLAASSDPVDALLILAHARKARKDGALS